MRKLAIAVACAAVSTTVFSAPRDFNPAISVILDGQYGLYDNNPEDYHLPGFQLGGESGLTEQGFKAGHSELVMDANIDDAYYGKFTLAFAQHEGEMETAVEEAYVETMTLPAGLSLRMGRFFSGVGYLNSKHRHSWDFADAPLVYRAMMGGQNFDDGGQARWLAPTDMFFQVSAEVMRGESFPAGGASDKGTGAKAVYMELGDDFGKSSSWQVGLNYWWAEVVGRTGAAGHAHGGGSAETPSYSGDSTMTAIDFVWKYSPNGNRKQGQLIFQAEYFMRDEEGAITMLDSAPLESSSYDGHQTGWYAQAAYRFLPRWRVGARYDSLHADNKGDDEEVLEEAGLLEHGHTHEPTRFSLMLDHDHSEFSRIRFQFNQDNSTEETDNQFMMQYTMSLGSHGAHSF
jgi:hypothetical protein